MNNSGYKPLITGIIIIALVTGSYQIGFTAGRRGLPSDQPQNIDFGLFWTVWDKVNDKFAGKVDNQKMVYEAINGALRSLDDPYTLFLPPTEAKQFQEDLQGSFDGIGAEIEKRDDALTIVAPLEDSPAQKAGIRAKDIILKIDGTETTNMTVDDAIAKIRGQKGTTVKLAIYREGATQPIDIEVTRNTIVVKSVKWEVRSDNIGYIKISQFGQDTKGLVDDALAEMNAKKPRGVIIDVRNDPGGYLDAAVDITSRFTTERGAIVKEQDKVGGIKELKATSQPSFTSTPIVILVNGGSASAAEIFSGALQDFGRAKLIGEKTFGKGSVQELEPLTGGGAVRITVAKWLTPKDRQISKVGIAPDIEVKLTEDDYKNGKDPQLDRAVAELSK